MNEQEQSQEQRCEQTAPATPPPFRPDMRQEAQESTASPTLAERIAAMGLDEAVSEQLAQITRGMNDEQVTPELLNTLAHGITHDEDVENADAAGYLRGRNENIEAVLHPEPEANDDTHATPVFPRYCRRSIWES